MCYASNTIGCFKLAEVKAKYYQQPRPVRRGRRKQAGSSAASASPTSSKLSMIAVRRAMLLYFIPCPVVRRTSGYHKSETQVLYTFVLYGLINTTSATHKKCFLCGTSENTTRRITLVSLLCSK